MIAGKQVGNEPAFLTEWGLRSGDLFTDGKASYDEMVHVHMYFGEF